MPNNLPPAIIFVNSDITELTKNNILEQLYVHESITLEEFEERITINPDYPNSLHNFGIRILITLPDFHDDSLRNLADIVIFVKAGLANVLKNNFGPPGLSVPIGTLNIYQLLRYNNSPYVVILPKTGRPSNSAIGGLVADQILDPSGVHDVNPDNIYNNIDFINRK